MRYCLAICGVFLLLAGTATSSLAGVPNHLNVQGRLTDSTGTPLPSGNKTLSFSIHDQQSGGNQVWPSIGTEDQIVTTGSDGLWTVLLGIVEPLSSGVFSDSSRWLEISVDDGINPSETLPRVRLVTGPYAYRVATVDGASGGTITSRLSVGPGHTNTGVNAFVAGESNTASGNNAVVEGQGNVAGGELAVIGGGGVNNATQFATTIGGGVHNTATANYATVGGGFSDSALGSFSAVTGGTYNVAAGNASTVAGGRYNKARGDYAVVGGGGGLDPFDSNLAKGAYSTVGGGQGNRANADSSTIAGGVGNTTNGHATTISGGLGNIANGYMTTVGGGLYNTASFSSSTVGGGDSNAAINTAATVGGGLFNFAEGHSATVAGGLRDTAMGSQASVCGGSYNNCSGVAATIAGGTSNRASGDHSIIAGGQQNRASGNYSFAAGDHADAAHTGAFVWSAGGGTSYFSSTADYQFLVRAPGHVGINTNYPLSPLMVQSEDNWRPAAGNGWGDFNVGNGTYGLCIGIALGGGGAGTVHIWPKGNAEQIMFASPAHGDIMLIRQNGHVGIGEFSAPNILTLANVNSVEGRALAYAWDTYSSRRWKMNIKTITGALDKVQQLRGVEYDSKENGKHDIGLIAEEVGEVIPEVVTYEKNGVDAQSMDYAKLVPVLIEAVKAQQKQIADLRSLIESQTAQR